MKKKTKIDLCGCALADEVLEAAAEYEKAHTETRQCTDLILSSGVTNKARRIMKRYMAAEKRLLDVCAKVRAFSEKKLNKQHYGPAKEDLSVVAALAIKSGWNPKKVKKWRAPKSVCCHVGESVKRSPRQEAGV